ncbi:MAG TPA: aminopeptidase P family protein [Candidatus Marinimicrobia bacterium]|nr:aminopeptidase P family protein [Candidatus Neomarinimicrobiota bacterium]HIO89774.1 aminopeptidase P family protein [Candidatus Neomarinimicrobiota bacterium]
MSLTELRVEELRSRLVEEGFDGMYVTYITNVRYLSGFTGSAGSCLILEDTIWFVSDGRYDTQSKQQVKGMEILIGSDPHIQILHKHNVFKGKQKIAFEGDHVSVSDMEKLRITFPECDWTATSEIVERIAMVKDESEIRATRTAVEITDQTFDQIVPEIRPGVTEKEIAAKISYTYKMLGAEADAFDSIIAAGPNSALPHARPGDREIQAGDFVVLDFGAKYEGYHADMTRTVVVKEATDKHREIYETVWESQRLGCEAARDGVACKEVDDACRDHINDKGYGDYFNHGTGHGLGLEIHTNPRFSQLSNDTVYANYLMTIEPGIYVPEFGGVRIEDDVLIQKDGCEILNQTSKDLLVLD